MSIRRAHIFVRGFVQGVGFRPFVYGLANAYGLKGYVSNLADAGVEIVVEGEEKNLAHFVEDLSSKKPQISRIDEIEVRWEAPKNDFSDFSISKSQEAKFSVRSVIPVDLGICDACITEIRGQTRFHGYPFTSCAQCGPRFTMIYRLPYDRANTSMVVFPFCEECQREYLDPHDRRYDVQGFACPKCGPHVTLLDSRGNVLPTEDPIAQAASLLTEGAIFAIKGIGGFHLSVDASNNDAVIRLRKNRRRPAQPFAVMSHSVNRIREYANVGKEEEMLLASPQRPIVVLRKSENCNLAESVAPGLDSVGVMLPYTGLHWLLLESFKNPALVMTSANFPGKPIIKDEEVAFRELGGVVDYYLIHDRKIVNRCDDSVIKVLGSDKIFLRKSRGFAPSYLTVGWNIGDKYILGLGSELNNCASLFVQNQIITTQHIGDTQDLETLDYMVHAIKFIEETYGLNAPEVVACDMNPSFLTSRRAHELSDALGSRLVAVQHHHAHAAAVMAENSVEKEQKTISIIIDGAGYGLDGSSWGGEIFLAGYSDFERLAYLHPQPMPGGDLCAYYPARMLAAILSTIMPESEIEKLFEKNASKYFRHGIEELKIVLEQSREKRVMKTSSLGRLLDALAVSLDLCWLRTYEGEPPMRLESLANHGRPGLVDLELEYKEEGNKIIFDTSNFVLSVIEKKNSFASKDVAYAIHKAISEAFSEAALMLAERFGQTVVGLTGGAAANFLIHNFIKEKIIENKMKFIYNKHYPCGDGCVSLGQVIVASTTLM